MTPVSGLDNFRDLLSIWMLIWGACLGIFAGTLFVFSRFASRRRVLQVSVGRWLMTFSRTRSKFWKAFIAATILFLVGFGALFTVSPPTVRDVTPEPREDVSGPVVMVLIDLSMSVRVSPDTSLALYEEMYARVVDLGFPTGLIIFSESAYIARYPTKDKEILLRSAIDKDTLTGVMEDLPGGTNIGNALRLTNAFFKDETFRDAPKIIILLSDLEDNVSAVMPALEKLMYETSRLEFYAVRIGGNEIIPPFLADRFKAANITGLVAVKNRDDLARVDYLLAGVKGKERGSVTLPPPSPGEEVHADNSPQRLREGISIGLGLLFVSLLFLREVVMIRVN